MMDETGEWRNRVDEPFGEDRGLDGRTETDGDEMVE
jgi:hypothetical protein